MKKGLRPPVWLDRRTTAIPTADLMKKGLRQVEANVLALVAIPTADLMKKGLRQFFQVGPLAQVDSNSRPDEEGIKTDQYAHLESEAHSNSRPDEEGIKTSPSNTVSRAASIPTADLMKKGLRLIVHIIPIGYVEFQQQT